MLINRIEVGLEGLASHSSRHSRSINSFNLYTLKLKGSLLGTSTLRLAKYLLSSLKGCRAPDVSSRVTVSTGPVAFAAAGGVSLSLAGTLGDASSEAGPMAVENCLVTLWSGSATAAGGAGGGFMDWTMAVCVSVRVGPTISCTWLSAEVLLSGGEVEASWLSEAGGFEGGVDISSSDKRMESRYCARCSLAQLRKRVISKPQKSAGFSGGSNEVRCRTVARRTGRLPNLNGANNKVQGQFTWDG